MPVSTVHAAYERRNKTWRIMRDVVEGHDAVQKGGVKYLPKLQGQNDDEYKAYRERATFFNGTGRTVDALSGMVFRKPPTITQPEGMKVITADMTLDGVPLVQFAEKLIEELLVPTRVGVLVDFPKNDASVVRTEEQAKREGLRVYATIYKAESIINWRTAKVGGKTVLSLVVLREERETPDPADPYKLNCETVYRVLRLTGGRYEQEVFVERKENSTSALVSEGIVSPLMAGKSIDYIPFVFFGAEGNDPTPDTPVLYDLAVVNLAHYRNVADFEHGAHFTGLPTAVISGVQDDDDDTYRIGSSTAWVFGDPQAKASFLEFKGEGLGTLERAIKAKEVQMAALGARLLAPEKSGVEAADTVAMKREGEVSVLSALANAVSRGLTEVLVIMRDWARLIGDVSIALNTEYTVHRMSAQEVTALLQAVASSRISTQTFYESLVKGEVIAGTRSYEEEQVLIAEDAASGLGMADNPDDAQ